MNEHIRDLYEQACDIERENELATKPYKDRVVIKFAELIVRECIGCCESVISDPVPESVDTWLNGGSQCIQEIKEHFGVKE